MGRKKKKNEMREFGERGKGRKRGSQKLLVAPPFLEVLLDSLMKMRCPIKYGSQFCSFVFRVRVRAEYELLFIFVINIHMCRED